MAQKRACDVSPTSEQEKYSIALMNQSGEWWGLDVPLFQIFPSTNNAPAPVDRVNFVSYHTGRGYDKYAPDQNGLYDSYNGWLTTPGKFHPTLQQRFAKGLRNADGNMPYKNQVVWQKLTGNQAVLAVSFTASASYSARTIIALIRKNVPAGTVGAPSNLTVTLKSDSAGSPGATLQSSTITANSVETISRYYTFAITLQALTSGTTYWICFSTASADKSNAAWEIACDPTASGKKASSLGGTYSATTFSPYFRITDPWPSRQYKPFMYDQALYLVAVQDDGTTASKLYLNGVRGRATGTQSSTTLQDTSHGAYGATNWPTNRFAEAYIRIIRGTGKGQVRQITSNTADTFTVSPAWDITPVAGSSEYVVYGTEWFVEIAGTGLSVVTGTPVVANGIVFIPQGDSTAIREMRINYADADVHEFRTEALGNNAYFLETGFDTTKNEPVIWRARNTTVSVNRASTAPSGTALAWGTNLSFGTNILTGENTSLITGLLEKEGVLHVLKEDGMYIVQNDRAVRVKMGIEPTPDVENGFANAVAGDKNMYVSFRNDVYLASSGGAYPTGLNINLPSNRSGRIYSLMAAEGWLFAAINGGTNNYSSVMKFSLDTKAWSEQIRGLYPGYRIRNLMWQPCPETRNRLWWDYAGDMMFQEFPINGTRPYDDKEIRYEHEGVMVLPTIDLGTTDPKYFAVLTVTSQGLATDDDPEKGSIIVVECQTDNDIGTDTWEHVGYLETSPSASVEIGRGNKRMIRPRLRLISRDPQDPVIVETIGLSLFSRRQLAHEWSIQFGVTPDDDEQNSVDLLMWLRDAAKKAEPLTMKSRFTLFHDRLVTLADEPRYQITELDQPNSEMEAQIWLRLTEVL